MKLEGPQGLSCVYHTNYRGYIAILPSMVLLTLYNRKSSEVELLGVT